MKKNDFGEGRLRNLLNINKKEIPDQMIKIVKYEIFHLLKNYFEVTGDDIQLTIDLIDNEYSCQVNFKSEKIKIARTF